jgi:hypothetical protein
VLFPSTVPVGNPFDRTGATGSGDIDSVTGRTIAIIVFAASIWIPDWSFVATSIREALRGGDWKGSLPKSHDLPQMQMTNAEPRQSSVLQRSAPFTNSPAILIH